MSTDWLFFTVIWGGGAAIVAAVFIAYATGMTDHD